MKILHTSDWHLKHKNAVSKTLDHGNWDRLCQEKLNILNRIPILADKYEVDIVTIGGDIFDTSNPPECLKAELCKILNSFSKDIVVKIIPGRTGDHDYTSKDNYVIMDLKEAYKNNIVIYDEPFCEVCQGVGMFHLMLTGISDFYKHTVDLSDEMFSLYNTVLLGDYHGWYYKKYGKKSFLYPNCPYPTRFGEIGGNVAIIDFDKYGNIVEMKRINVHPYEFIQKNITDLDNLKIQYKKAKTDKNFVLKFKIETDVDVIDVNSEMNALKEIALKDDNCIDFVWEIKSSHSKSNADSDHKNNIDEICKSYIADNAPYPNSTLKVFQKVEAEI